MAKAGGFLAHKISKGYEPNVLQKLAKRRLELINSNRSIEIDVSTQWVPNPGPQEQFFRSDCREILYGGSAGGGKSAALTALPLRWAHLKGFEGVILRRESVQLDDLIQKSKDLFTRFFPGLEPVHSPHFEWTFPSGGRLKYRHCQREHDYAKYDGWEINFLGFDELTHFTERQYKAICARVRSANRSLPTLIRATTNPGGEGHDWVFRHWGAWLDPEFEAEGLEPRINEFGEKIPPANSGEVFWIRTNEDGTETYFRTEPASESGKSLALSRTFIAAKLEDNPHLANNDLAYLSQLNALDAVRRAQLRDGNWLVRPASGLFFKREWVSFVDFAPSEAERVRCWDLAATEKKSSKDDPDWTVGVLLAKSGSQIFVENVVRRRSSPGDVEKLIKATAEMDGRNVRIGIPQDPGQAGKAQVENLVRMLESYSILSQPESGDKITRFGPFSSQAEHGNVKIVNAPWNKEYIEELESFPTKGVHDDQVDATSGAYMRILNFISDAAPIRVRSNRR